MVWHEDISNNSYPENVATLCQPRQENLPILIGKENLLPAVSSVHDVIVCTRILDSKRPCHTPLLANYKEFVKSKDLTPNSRLCMGTFRKLLLILYSRRLSVRLMGLIGSGKNDN
jgi:hypothetical protein